MAVVQEHVVRGVGVDALGSWRCWSRTVSLPAEGRPVRRCGAGHRSPSCPGLRCGGPHPCGPPPGRGLRPGPGAGGAVATGCAAVAGPQLGPLLGELLDVADHLLDGPARPPRPSRRRRRRRDGVDGTRGSRSLVAHDPVAPSAIAATASCARSRSCATCSGRGAKRGPFCGPRTSWPKYCLTHRCRMRPRCQRAGEVGDHPEQERGLARPRDSLEKGAAVEGTVVDVDGCTPSVPQRVSGPAGAGTVTTVICEGDTALDQRSSTSGTSCDAQLQRRAGCRRPVLGEHGVQELAERASGALLRASCHTAGSCSS